MRMKKRKGIKNMTKILTSKDLRKRLKEKLLEKIENLNEKPVLAIIRLGQRPEDLSYEKGLTKTAKELSIPVDIYKLEVQTKTSQLISLIEKLNEDKKVKGILIFRPLPKHIDEKEVALAISPQKDLDCINPINKAKIYDGDMNGFIPLSPKAAVMLMEDYGYNLAKRALIINRSQVVGKPLAMLLLNRNATVTIAHSKTENIKELIKKSDYVFTAMGKMKSLDRSFFTEKSIIIDLSIGIDENGKLCGDIDQEDVNDFVQAYTPVPGGVGSLTNLLLLESLIHE